jgi:hypothetical protein
VPVLIAVNVGEVAAALDQQEDATVVATALEQLARMLGR